MADHNSIGSWTPFELEQFIRGKLQGDPTMLPGNLKHDVLDVRKSLHVSGLPITPHNKGFIYGAQMTTGAAQTIGAGITAVTFSKTHLANVPRVKPNSHDPVWVQAAAPYTTVQINNDGWYLFIGGVGWVANPNGTRDVWVGTNGPAGAGLFGMSGRSTLPAPGGAVVTNQISCGVDYYTAGTQLSLWVQQGSGGNLNIVNATNGNFLFGMRLNLDSNS